MINCRNNKARDACDISRRGARSRKVSDRKEFTAPRSGGQSSSSRNFDWHCARSATRGSLDSKLIPGVNKRMCAYARCLYFHAYLCAVKVRLAAGPTIIRFLDPTRERAQASRASGEHTFRRYISSQTHRTPHCGQNDSTAFGSTESRRVRKILVPAISGEKSGSKRHFRSKYTERLNHHDGL